MGDTDPPAQPLLMLTNQECEGEGEDGGVAEDAGGSSVVAGALPGWGGAGERLMGTPLEWVIPAGTLAPGASLTLSGTLRFTDPRTPVYSQVCASCMTGW